MGFANENQKYGMRINFQKHSEWRHIAWAYRTIFLCLSLQNILQWILSRNPNAITLLYITMPPLSTHLFKLTHDIQNIEENVILRLIANSNRKSFSIAHVIFRYLCIFIYSIHIWNEFRRPKCLHVHVYRDGSTFLLANTFEIC